jgi:hypothetical protein
MSYYGQNGNFDQNFTIDVEAQDMSAPKKRKISASEKALNRSISDALNKDNLSKETKNTINFTLIGAVLGFFVGLSIGKAKILSGVLGAGAGLAFSQWYNRKYAK